MWPLQGTRGLQALITKNKLRCTITFYIKMKKQRFAKQKFIIDTSIFVNPKQRELLGPTPQKALLTFIEVMKNVPDVEIYMPTSIYKELGNFLNYDEIEGLNNVFIIRSPDASNLRLPATLLQSLVEEIRSRIDKGLKVSEDFLKRDKEELPKKIRLLRQKYRETTRGGIIDSTEDVDVILLAKELNATIATADDGIKRMAERLGIETVDLPSMFEKIGLGKRFFNPIYRDILGEVNVIVETQREIGDYLRVKDDYREVPRGTVIIKKRIIKGYPRIKRFITLEKGIKRYFKKEPFIVETKIDGYNVRVFKIKNKIFALTRGGYVCPFTTEWAREHEPFQDFFEDFPTHVIHAEAIGENPYNCEAHHFDIKGLKFMVFDISDGQNKFLHFKTKKEIVDAYSINAVPDHGLHTYKDIKKIKDLLLELNDTGKEGIIMKSLDSEKRFKHVVINADINDIKINSSMIFELPQGYFTQRILRSAVFLLENGLNPEEYYTKLGRAFYEGLIATLKQEDPFVHENFVIRVKHLSTWKELKRHLSKEMRIEANKIYKSGEYHVIFFKKIYRKSSKKIRAILRGKAIVD